MDASFYSKHSSYLVIGRRRSHVVVDAAVAAALPNQEAGSQWKCCYQCNHKPTGFNQRSVRARVALVNPLASE